MRFDGEAKQSPGIHFTMPRRSSGTKIMRCRLAIPPLLLSVLLVIVPSLAVAQVRVTSAANVRLRSAPELDAPVLMTLPLGTELQQLATPATGDWVHVRTGTGAHGWIYRFLTTEVPDGELQRVVELIINERLALPGMGLILKQNSSRSSRSRWTPMCHQPNRPAWH
jgi:hypothetical protein